MSDHDEDDESFVSLSLVSTTAESVLAVSADGLIAYTSSDADDEVSLLLRVPSQEADLVLDGHETQATACAFAAAAPVLASCSVDSIFFYDTRKLLQSPTCGRSVVAPFATPPTRSALNPVGSLLVVCAAGDADGYVVSVTDGRLTAVLQGHGGSLTDAAFVSASRVVTTSVDRSFCLWDVERRELLHQSAILSSSPIAHVAVDVAWSRFCCCTDDCVARFFDVDTGRELFALDVLRHRRRRRQRRQVERQRKRREASAASLVISKRSTSALALNNNNSNYGGDGAVDGGGEGDDDDISASDDDGGHTPVPLACLFVPAPGRQLADDESRRDVMAVFRERLEAKIDVPPLLMVVLSDGIECFRTDNYASCAVFPFTPQNIQVSEEHTNLSFQTVGFVSDAVLAHNTTHIALALRPCFTRALHVARIAASDAFGSGNKGGGGGGGASPAVAEDEEEKEVALSVFRAEPLPATSVLRMHRFGDDSSASSGGKSKRRATSGGIVDKPITFRTRIKSSGYGPATNTKKKNSKKRSSITRQQQQQQQQAYPRNAPVVTERRHVADVQHTGPVLRMRFSATGASLLTASVDSSCHLVRLPLSGGRQTVFSSHNGPVRDCAWSHTSTLDGLLGDRKALKAQSPQPTVLTCSADKTARLFKPGRSDPALVINRSVGSSSRIASNTAFSAEIAGCSFFNHDRFVLLISANVLGMYKYELGATVQDGDDLKRLKSARRGRYRRVFAFPDPASQAITAMAATNTVLSNLVVLGTSRREIKVVDVHAEAVVATVDEAHSRPVHTVRLCEYAELQGARSSSCELFVSSACDSTVKLWDLRTPHMCVRTFGEHVNRQQPVGCAISPCTRFVASGSEDKLAYVYDLGSGKRVQRLSGHPDVVSDVAWHPSRPLLATASYDGKIRLFA